MEENHQSGVVGMISRGRYAFAILSKGNTEEDRNTRKRACFTPEGL